MSRDGVSGWARAPQITHDGIARLATLVPWSESVMPWLVCLSLPAPRVEKGRALFRLDTALRSGEGWACRCLTCLLISSHVRTIPAGSDNVDVTRASPIVKLTAASMASQEGLTDSRWHGES